MRQNDKGYLLCVVQGFLGCSEGGWPSLQRRIRGMEGSSPSGREGRPCYGLERIWD